MKTVPVIALCLVSIFSLAPAQMPISLANSNFEAPSVAPGGFAPPDSWFLIGSPVVFALDTGAPDDAAPAGRQILSLAPSDGVSTSLGSIAPGTTLCITALVGGAPGSFFTSSSIANLHVIIKIDGIEVMRRNDLVSSAPGEFTRAQVTYHHPIGALPGGNVDVDIVHLASGFFSSVYVDDVEMFVSDVHLSRGDIVQGDAESRPAGPLVDVTPRFENWEATGTASVVAASSYPWMPTRGAKYVEVSTEGSGPGAAVSRSSAELTVFVESPRIAFDWTALTNEIPGATDFYDRLSFEVIERVSPGSFIQHHFTALTGTDLAGETWVPSQAVSAATGSGMALELGATRTLVADLPPSLVGRRATFLFLARNFGDGTIETILQVDDIRFLAEAKFPGTDPEALTIASAAAPYDAFGSTRFGLTGGPGEDVKSAGAGYEIQLGVRAGSPLLHFSPFLLVAQLTPTGNYAPSYPEFGFWLDLAATAVVIDGLGPTSPLGGTAVIAPGGNVYPFLAPAGLFGFSILAQFVVPSPLGSNGFLITTDAHEITF